MRLSTVKVTEQLTTEGGAPPLEFKQLLNRLYTTFTYQTLVILILVYTPCFVLSFVFTSFGPHLKGQTDVIFISLRCAMTGAVWGRIVHRLFHYHAMETKIAEYE